MKRLLILLCLMSTWALSAQEVKQKFVKDSLTVYFRQGYATWDASYMDNGQRVEAFIERVLAIENSSDTTILKVICKSGASPEGEVENNQRLAEKRAETITAYLRQRVNIAPRAENVVLMNEDYASLARMVEASDMPYREEVLAILHEADGRTMSEEEAIDCKWRMKRLHEGKVWDYMLKHFFPYLRKFDIVVSLGIDVPEDMVYAQPLNLTAPLPPMAITPTKVHADPLPEEEGWRREWLIKSNAIGWAMLVPNVAFEVDLAEHWSFNLPIYFSGLDYFSHKVKFRMFGIYPEVRYWFGKEDGLFVGAHLGLVYYNYAVNGKYRIQDHDKDTPAWGGGLNVGYRMPISKSNRWKVEFTAGCGLYDVRYDKFYNQKNGLRAVIDRHRTKFVLDNVAVNFSYSFYSKK